MNTESCGDKKSQKQNKFTWKLLFGVPTSTTNSSSVVKKCLFRPVSCSIS